MPKLQLEKKENAIFLLLGSHLFPLEHLTAYKNYDFIMIEDYGLCTKMRYHKMKLLFLLTAMRNYRDLLNKHGFKVNYFELNDDNIALSFESTLSSIIAQHGLSSIISFTIEDRWLRNILQDLFTKLSLTWTQIESPMFLNSLEDIKKKLGGKKRPFMKTFYEHERKERLILMDGDKPAGGHFSFDTENRKKLPAHISIPPLPTFKACDHEKALRPLIEKLFTLHPGVLDELWLPTNRNDAVTFLNRFLSERFKNFGDYEDAISKENDFIFHSTLSPLLNCGLLTPKEVLKEALKYGAKKNIPLNSLEGFIRQILGWREFIRGIDLLYGPIEHSRNFFSHKRKMASCWYNGTTGIEPLDNAIKKTLRLGYCHHIERLMILSNLMLLSQIDPKEVYQWFMEYFIDSAEWVMGPNVFGMGQMSDGGIFATKPYICGSNYILKMSDYKKGPWCEIVDGLYWRFIEQNKQFFKKNPRMAMMVRQVENMDQEKKQRLMHEASAFLERTTK